MHPAKLLIGQALVVFGAVLRRQNVENGDPVLGIVTCKNIKD